MSGHCPHSSSLSPAERGACDDLAAHLLVKKQLVLVQVPRLHLLQI